MKLELNIKYDIGTVVYLKTDEEQKARILTSFEVKRNHNGYFITYFLTLAELETAHNEFEFTNEPDELIRLGLNG